MPPIRTYDTVTFRERFMQSGRRLEAMLKPGFDRFFIVRVEDMIRLMKLPVPPNRATSHILIYLTSGEAIMRIGSETCRIERGECLVVPAGQVFSFDQVDINTGYLLGFQDDFLPGGPATPEQMRRFDFLRIWGNPIIRFGDRAAGYAETVFVRLYEDYQSYGLKNAEIIQAYTFALLCEMQACYRPLTPGARQQPVALANRFQELLFTHLRTKHRVSDYAGLLNVSPNHLNKVLKQITGKSPATWIDETLVLEAKVLLYQTGLPIGAVAAEIGLFDASYFSRLFKRHTGMTPLDFRKMIEKS